MAHTIDYYFAPQSPWTYLGHERFLRIARGAGAHIHVRPMDLGGQVFPVSGGVPLAQRPAQRQAYRLVELQRWRDFLGLPLNIKPRYFPVGYDAAARLIVAVELADGTEAALRITGSLLAAVWAEERNIDDATTRTELLAACGLPVHREADAHKPEVAATYARYTQEAIAAQVFGAPSYVVNGEVFWGQDRLDFLERRLAQP
jgi:2-hydroxychromene-2-carboxylate isomerase